MSVHEEISKHSEQQHRHIAEFMTLDRLREAAIEQAIKHCKDGFPFQEAIERINHITEQINSHAKKGISPTRQYVSEAMVRAYAEKC